MKKALILIATIALMITLSNCPLNSANKNSTIHCKVTSGGTHQWWDHLSGCAGQGETCVIKTKPCDTNAEIITTVGPSSEGYIVTVEFLYEEYDVTIEETTFVHTQSPQPNFILPSGSSLTIISCDDFPELNNTSIDISGMVCNSAGNLEVFIPSDN